MSTKHTPGPWTKAERLNGPWWHISATHTVDGKPCIGGRQAIAAVHGESKKGAVKYAEMFEANAHLIAAAPELLEALIWREQFERRPGEDSNETLERIAEVFLRETGYLRPGKDCCFNPPEIRQQAWDEWMNAGRAKVRAAIAKATGQQP